MIKKKKIIRSTKTISQNNSSKLSSSTMTVLFDQTHIFIMSMYKLETL